MTMHTRVQGLNRPDPMPAATERRAPVRDLAQALKAGDLAKASEAYKTLAAQAPQRVARNPDGPFARVGAALAAGDLAAARAAFGEVFTSHLPTRGGDAPSPDPVRAGRPMPGAPGGLLDVSA